MSAAESCQEKLPAESRDEIQRLVLHYRETLARAGDIGKKLGMAKLATGAGAVLFFGGLFNPLDFGTISGGLGLCAAIGGGLAWYYYDDLRGKVFAECWRGEQWFKKRYGASFSHDGKYIYFTMADGSFNEMDPFESKSYIKSDS